MFYENIFDKIIVDTIKGKKVKSSFSTDEHNIIGDNIINKYTLIASSYLNNKEITEKDTVNYAEYKGIVNNLDKPKHESRIDKALNIKLSQKEQNILSYYAINQLPNMKTKSKTGYFKELKYFGLEKNQISPN